VLAAASLTESFQELAETFEAAHPGVEVRLVLESSATLAGQVVEGAPADVLATADQATMQRAVDAGAADSPEVFATNQLVLVTPPGNPAHITELADLDDPAVSYVTCVESAPCGSLAAQLLAEDGVAARPRSLEVDVKAVLAKVVADEADAGLVYATDAFAARSQVTTWPVPGSEHALTACSIAVVDQVEEPELAAEWVDLVLSAEGQDVLADAGFGPPGAAGTS
jgi:molybdate transport system substrate-binding protein